TGFCQQITGEVKYEKGVPMAVCTVSLLRSKDSGVVKLGLTGTGGAYQFQQVKPGNYIVQASYVGFDPARSAPFSYIAQQDIKVPELTIIKKNNALKDVTVTAKKPLIEVKADRTIVNIEGTINASGSDALELLKKSPGVSADKDDNLSMNGKNGVQIYIDGRPTPLGGADLTNYLKTLHASQIESIELITNPSAKYEAAGNAGIINIRIKKDNSLGTNGSVTMGFSIGIYPKYTGGFSLNHRNKKINLYGSYNHNAVKATSNSFNYRTVLDTLFDQHNNVSVRIRGNNFKTGLDYYLNKKQTIGVMVTGNIGHNTVTTDAATPISYIPTGKTQRILIAGGENEARRTNVVANLNYSFIDGNKKNFTLNADAGYYQIDGDQLQPNVYLDATGQIELSRIVYNMISPSRIYLYSVKGDYEQDFQKGKLAMGFKSSWANTMNDFQRYNVYTSGKILDQARSNNFNYHENINAGYLNFNRSFKFWTIQAGLRVEQTVSEGKSTGFKAAGTNYLPYDSSFKRSYVDAFPSAAISYARNPMKQWTLNYSRRIDRPIYQDLNPFEFKLDEYTFAKGNTQLRPQYTNSFGLSFLFNQKLNTSITFSHVRDIFSQLLDTSERSKIYQSKQNLATQDIVSLNISYPLRYKAFNMFINTSTYYSKYTADFGPGRLVNLDVFATRIVLQNSLKFGKTWTAEMGANYSSPSIMQGTFKAKALYAFDAGIQKQVFNGLGTFRASVSDIFKTFNFSATSNFAGQQVISRSYGETRMLKLNFSYRFGNNQIKAARQRKTGLEEEAGRVQ
ncbi:MAG: TonB-dependent receptor, partial [Chitinophagaceae bacterium]|nr:TonB-dependent receptor [Chitinophagaceae bacterium]